MWKEGIAGETLIEGDLRVRRRRLRDVEEVAKEGEGVEVAEEDVRLSM